MKPRACRSAWVAVRRDGRPSAGEKLEQLAEDETESRHRGWAFGGRVKCDDSAAIMPGPYRAIFEGGATPPDRMDRRPDVTVMANRSIT